MTALCDLLRVQTTFVASLENGVPHLEVVCGHLEVDVPRALLPEAWHELTVPEPGLARDIKRYDDIFVWDGYWLIPLRATSRAQQEGDGGDEQVIGVVGIAGRAQEPDLSDEERAGIEGAAGSGSGSARGSSTAAAPVRDIERMIPESKYSASPRCGALRGREGAGGL